MSRPAVEKPNLTPFKAQCRRIGRDKARQIMGCAGDVVRETPAEVTVEAFRQSIRSMSSRIAELVGDERAVGVLVGAVEKIVPAWTAENLRAERFAASDRRLAALMRIEDAEVAE